MPIISRIRPCPTACGVLPGCVGHGLVELRRELCALCESYCSTVSHSAHSSRRSSTRPQPTTVYTPRQNTACSSTRSYSADEGHNDARNMLR